MEFTNLTGSNIAFVLVTIVIAVILVSINIHNYKRISAHFSPRALLKMLPGNKPFATYPLKSYLIFLSLAGLLIAYIGPTWGSATERVKSEGADIVFTLDVSQSMRAFDFARGNRPIDRLEMAKAMIKNFVQEHKNHRYGLVIFAGDAFTLSPITLDTDAFLNFVQTVDFSDVKKQGTNLRLALETSIERLQQGDISGEQRGRMIVLITDGEEQQGDIAPVLGTAKDVNIPIVTVGVGSTEGSMIPIPNRFGGYDYKRYNNEPIVTKLNEEPLKEIAAETNGLYFHPQTEAQFLQISSATEELATTEISGETKQTLANRYQYFVLLAFLLFLLSLALPRTVSFRLKNTL